MRTEGDQNSTVWRFDMDQEVNIEWAEERSGFLRGSNAFVLSSDYKGHLDRKKPSMRMVRLL